MLLPLLLGQGTAGPVTHATSGVLAGQGAAVVGAATKVPNHQTAGVLAGQGATVVGAARHNIPHPTSGVLTGLGATLDGAADREAAIIPHIATGALTGGGATLAGSAQRFRTISSTGALVGQGAVITGSASNFTVRTSSGALVGPGATVTGDADHEVLVIPHVSSGVLVGQGSAVAGTAFVSHLHATAGVLVGPGSEIVGDAELIPPVEHETSGELIGDGAEVVGAADHQAYDLTITREMATQLYQIYLLHGLTAGIPLVVAPTTRSAGGLVQSVSQTGGTVSIATTANTTTGLPSLVQMIDELAALHGLGETLSVTATSRTAGAISQTMATTGGVTTVTRV